MKYRIRWENKTFDDIGTLKDKIYFSTSRIKLVDSPIVNVISWVSVQEATWFKEVTWFSDENK